MPRPDAHGIGSVMKSNLSTSLITSSIALGCLLLCPSKLLADPVDIELIDKVMKGQGWPTLVLTANDPVTKA